TLANGVVTAVVMDDVGSGYSGLPDVVFIGATGSGATGTPILSRSTITGVTVTNGGSDYSGTVNVVFSSLSGPAHATLNLMPFGVNGISIATFLSRVWISRYPGHPYPASILFSTVGDPADFSPP